MVHKLLQYAASYGIVYIECAIFIGRDNPVGYCKFIIKDRMKRGPEKGVSIM